MFFFFLLSTSVYFTVFNAFIFGNCLAHNHPIPSQQLGLMHLRFFFYYSNVSFIKVLTIRVSYEFEIKSNNFECKFSQFCCNHITIFRIYSSIFIVFRYCVMSIITVRTRYEKIDYIIYTM